MTVLAQHPKVLESVRVPISMLRNPDTFGGKVDGDCLYGDLLVCDTKVVGMRDPAHANPIPRMVLPRLTECHVHLDKCHTVARMPAVGGDLFAAIEAQRADKELWTQEDIHQRASRGLEELIASGCGATRSHVDWSGASEILQPPIGWDVLTELACDYENQIELQVSPLIGVDDLVEPEIAEKLARMIAAKSNVMGVFVFDQKDRRAGIHAAFLAAEEHNLALDFHVDEGLVDGLNGIGLIADIALETGFSGPVLCGHACSLMNLDGRDCDEMIDKIARSGIHVASLPATNLYLQGRT
ncbi:MAG: amidohydrolase, partial [Pseudomonadota bacterium]